MSSKKAVICGNPGTGKTSLLNQFDSHNFGNTRATVALSSIQYSEIIGNKQVTIQVWDTPGQQTYRDVVKNLFHGAQVVILTFDITNSQSFDELPLWYNDVLSAEQPNFFYVVGTKLDLEESRKVQYNEAVNYAESIQATYFETSALENIHVKELFSDIANKLAENDQNETCVSSSQLENQESKQNLCNC